MPLSKFMLNTAKLTLDALFKASEADIRVHDIENIPASHVLYVVNHFTRMETAFLPYIIHKYTGQYCLSLADSSFFKGKLESILHKLGAVSTKDPDRDRILSNSLLTGNMSVIIYPEGQMIKDKKIVEKGKLLVYNTGIRRPPHSGAASIALRSEIDRQVIRKLYDKGRKEDLDVFMEAYGIDKKDLAEVLTGSTYIVPVNITYYPIRARNNILKKVVERFTGDMGERFAEELEVEGTMLTKGVDIDINFGKAIKMSNYINRTKIVSNIFKCGIETCIADIAERDEIKKLSLKVMQKYMNSIYKMATVNHDHIFAYILANYPKNIIHDYDFKNRASLATERIKELRLNSFHSTLLKRSNISADVFHEKYDSFMEEAVKNKLVEIKGDMIIRNSSMFSRIYNFHIVRKDNFIEVLNNEIEPLTEMTSMLRRIMLMPPWMIKSKVRDTFLKLDRKIYMNDYNRYYREGVTRHDRVGAPIFLHNMFNRYGVVLVHGYMAAPDEMRLLAEKIHKAGYSVYVVRLKGHGTSPKDLAKTPWQEWNESVNRGYVIMKNSVREFAICGFSTGAGLALLQAEQKGEKFKGLISIAAPLKLQDIRAYLSGTVTMFNSILKKFKLNNKNMEFIPNVPENADINYPENPVSGINELGKLMDIVEKGLFKIKIPALIIQATEDPVVNPKSAEEIYNRINSEDKKLIKIKSLRHGIVRGHELKKVTTEIVSFLDKIFER
ncbi:MAG TPA: alpha/beta hydrolase [Spirochaetota bacterium]|nr:alpha/beta hydrolase [Spirochaetota bacterium]HPJ33357.1 alpha/beta hydrolase [Spirochaetota bacterium]